MSGQNAKERPVYAVGYAQPPVATRFQKGRSGNPGGRRKKEDHYAQTSELILEEAFRPVMVREGNKVIKLPAIQAILRSQIQLAAKGNQAAQRAVLDCVRRVEDKREARHDALIQAAFEYRTRANNRQVRMAEKGFAIGTDAPHPNDISVDLHTGDVYFHHPDFSDESRPHHRIEQPSVRDLIQNENGG